MKFLGLAWALTSISQKQFWPGFDLKQYGEGNVHGVLSIGISDWTMPDTKTTIKRADHCEEKEIAD